MAIEYVGPVIAIGKKIIEIAEAIKNKELNAAVIQLQEVMMEFQSKSMEQKKEIERLEGEVKALKEQLRIKANLVYEGGAYWNKEESADGKGPFCPTCWTVDEKIVHLPARDDALLRRKCPGCNQAYRVTK